MTPIGRNILVRPDEAVTKTGALYIPEAAARVPTRGTVVAVGDGAPAVNPGDVVIYAKYSGSEYEIDGVTHLVITEDDVLLVEG